MPNEDDRLEISNVSKGVTQSEAEKEVKSKGKVHPCTSTEALYRPYGP